MVGMGEIIQKERNKQGLTQQQLADLTGISLSLIGGVEAGHSNFSLENTIKIARYLKIDMNVLCGLEKPSSPDNDSIHLSGLNERQKEAIRLIIDGLKKTQ